MKGIRDRVQVYGVDFSGARDAGERIWIIEAAVEGKVLSIGRCFKARDLAESGRDREKCLRALREFIAARPTALFGLDFPFGLPRKLVGQESWEEFILAFPRLYRDPEHFRDTCLKRASNRELRRLTDIQCKAPLSPYNLRMYKQTFYGITEIIHPLVRSKLASVIPMQRPRAGKPRLMEICPASTLKAEGLYRRYKETSRKDEGILARAEILSTLGTRWHLKIQEGEIQELILEDHDGDALDSVVAALAVFRNLGRALIVPEEPEYLVEGYVFV
ncbi:MAG: DUF429 domain-containing protein [Deltaproteobacteria bacterium]|nr:DUF429 domain-containing protein [Deltaproteobacteria bacterium]